MPGMLVLATVVFLGGVLSQQVHTDLDFLCSLSSPCKNGATCSINAGQIYCLCPNMFTGAICEHDTGLQQSNNAEPTATTLGDMASVDIAGMGTSNVQPVNEGFPFGVDAANAGGLSNGAVVDNSATSNMGLGGSVFRLASAERNLNTGLHSSLGSSADFRMSNAPGTNGNVAGGLSNQQTPPGNTHGRHLIQQDLKNTVILHNFMDGDIQRMLTGSRGSPERLMNEVNQITKLINSPKTINDAFPDQKLVDGNAVAVGSTRTAVGATFKDPTQVNDLPSFTPGKTKAMADTVNTVDFSSHKCKGTHREYFLNSKLYWVVEPTRVTKMLCPVGTLFSTDTCACTIVVNRDKDEVCRPDLVANFDYGMDDSSGNLLAHFASEDLRPDSSSGILCFNGSQKMGYPRYNGFDFRYTVFIMLRFITYVEKRDQLFPLLTNCATDSLTGEFQDPSLGIVLNRTNHLVIFMQTAVGMSLTSFKIEAKQWNTVTLLYDGKYLTATVNGQPPHIIPTTGNIERRHAPLVLGYCERYGYFNGCIDDFFVYHCIPNQRYISRLKNIA